MLSIVKKNMSYFIGYCGVIFTLTAILTLILGNENAVPLVMISGVLLFMLVFGPVFFNEQYEEKHKAYYFLDTLPVLCLLLSWPLQATSFYFFLFSRLHPMTGL